MFYLIARLTSLTGAFLYPAYASYKTLTKRPASEEELERWLMYWSVIGVFVSVEYVAEWLLRWMPFYWEAKTLFLLYLALPQTQGSTAIYRTHLEPFLHLHEREIDSALASLKTQFYTFLQARLRALWEHVSSVMLNQASAGEGGGGSAARDGPPSSTIDHPQQAPPSLGDPVSGPASMAWDIWRTYGPSIVAKGTALLAAAAPPPPSANRTSLFSIPAPSSSTEPATSAQELRRHFEAEAAKLPPYTRPSSSTGSHPDEAEGPLNINVAAASVYLPGGEDAGRYERIDKEDIGGSGNDSPIEPTTPPPKAGWFSGWSSASRAGYEKVKSD